MRQFHISKGTLAFLAWPITSANFVRIFCHLLRMSVDHITLHCFVLSFPMKITVSSLQYITAITIQCSAFSTLRVTFSHFHIIFISVPSSMLSSSSSLTSSHSIIARISQTPSALLGFKRSIMSARSQHRTSNTDGRTVPDTKCRIQPKECDMEHGNHSAGFSRSNVGSYSEVHKRATLTFSEPTKSHQYMKHRDQRRVYSHHLENKNHKNYALRLPLI